MRYRVQRVVDWKSEIMSNKVITLALGTMLGLSTLGLASAGASAAAMLPLSPLASGDVAASSNGIVQVDSKEI